MAKCKIRDKNIRLHEDNYKKLQNRMHYLKTFNPANEVKIMIDEYERENEPRVFKKVFVKLEVIKLKFLKGCKSSIDLDACHLKDIYKNIFLCTIILDGA